MKKIVLPIIAVAALAVTATTAAAGCNPKCATGSTCRYEAAGGKYYCAPNKSFMGSISKQPGASDGFQGSRVQQLKMISR